MQDIERLDKRIDELRQDFDEFKLDLSKRLERIQADLTAVVQITQFGRGVAWVLLKLGAILAGAIAIVGWLWDHVTWK